MERLRFADFHQDRLNPWLEEILQNPEFRYAAERARQLPREGLAKLDLHFSTIYRRANDEIKRAALVGNEQVLARLRGEYDQLIDYYRSTQDFRVLLRPEDLHLQDAPYQTENIILHLEGGDILTDPDEVNRLHERGVRSIGPLYQHDNLLGGGAKGSVNRGLTALGKRVVDRIVECGMVVDITHANRRTAHDILDRVEQYDKAVATHTAIGGLAQRYITPELLKKIAAKGGVVGFTPANVMFPTFEEYIDAYRETSELTGSTENLAVGSDLGGLEAGHLYEEFDEIGKLSRVAEELSRRGQFTDEQIYGIMFGNIKRIIDRLPSTE